MKGTVIYCGGFILPDKNAAAHRVTANAKILQKLGYNVVFLGVSEKPEAFPHFRKVASPDGFEAYEEAYPTTGKSWLKRMWCTDNLLTLARRYADLKMIILYNVPYITLCRMNSLKKLFPDLKITYDCTEWCPVTEGSFVKRMIKRLDAYDIRRRLARRTDGLIVISRLMENAYENTVPLLRMPPLTDTDDGIWQQSPDRTDAFEFCFAGVLDGNKEYPDRIVAALSKMSDNTSVLRFIGVTKEEFLDRYPLLRDIADCLGKRLIFTGRLSHDKTVKAVLSCDCYIFIRPSDLRNNAGFPTKFAESYTAGAYILTTSVSDIAEYIDGCGQIVTDTSPEAVAKAMTDAVSRGKDNSKHIRKNFDYRNYEGNMQKWLDGILK